jgi:hypothetical protein
LDFCKSNGELLNIGGVDCEENQQICQEEKISKEIQYFIYYGNGKREKLEIYQGIKFGFLVRQNLNLMENNVVEINNKNYMEKMKENLSKKMIILFSNRKGSSLLY